MTLKDHTYAGKGNISPYQMWSFRVQLDFELFQNSPNAWSKPFKPNAIQDDPEISELVYAQLYIVNSVWIRG